MKLLTIGLLFAGLLLAGCNEQQQVVIKTQYKTIAIPEQFYNCPQDAFTRAGIRTVADVDKLTDSRVARLIALLTKSNRECANSIRTIRNYLNSAKVRLDSSNK